MRPAHALVALLCVAAPGVLAAKPCTFSATLNDGTPAWFDLSALDDAASDFWASDGGYPDLGGAGHTYAFRFCSNATSPCRPSYRPNATQTGVAVQYWGRDGGCATKQCTDRATGQPACCTRECEVLGAVVPDAPKLTVVNMGGVPTASEIHLAYAPMPPDPSDPFFCPGNVPRSLVYHLFCEPSVEFALASFNEFNTTGNPCAYRMTASTKYACPLLSPP